MSNDLGPLALRGQEKQRRPKAAIGLGVNVPRIVECQQRHDAPSFLTRFRQQADHGVAQGGVDFGDGGKAIVTNPIRKTMPKPAARPPKTASTSPLFRWNKSVLRGKAGSKTARFS